MEYINMNKYRRNLINLAAILFSISAIFGFDIASAAVPFGPQKPAETGFGGDAEAVATDKWINESVRQVDGVLMIRSNNIISLLNPDDLGGKDGFIWQTMIEMTKNGKEMTIKQLTELANAIVAKYLFNIDLWPDVKVRFQTWGFSPEEIKTLQTKFETTSISSINFKSVQKIVNANTPIDASLTDIDAISIVGRYDKNTNKFVTDSGFYKDGALIDSRTGEEIPMFMIDNNYGSLYYHYNRFLIGTLTGNIPISVSGDTERLAQVGKASDLIANYLDKNEVAFIDGKNKDGSMVSNINVCINISQVMQEMLEDNNIDAYTVVLPSDGSTGHAAVAVKTGDIKYPDGKIYPTFVVIEPQIGTVMGQLGGSGTNVVETYQKIGIDFENAIVIKDYVLTKGYKQLVDSKSTEIYTYTNTREIEVGTDEFMSIGDVDMIMTTDIPPTNP